MKAQKIVIFDMDGTLIDTAEDITITVNHIRALHHDLPPLSQERVVEIINMQKRNLPKLFYGTETYETKDHALFESHYHEQCIQNVRLYEGIRETLEALKESDVKLSVATNAPSTFAKRMLSHVGVADYFDHLLGPDIAGTSKPDPLMLSQILGHYDFKPTLHHAWMVGDNQKDMSAAKNANIKSVFTTWGFGKRAISDIMIHNPQMLLKIVL